MSIRTLPTLVVIAVVIGCDRSSPPPAAIELPGYWFDGELDLWIGKPWDEISLAQYVQPPPSDLDDRIKYVVFYGRTCEHCEHMFNEDLTTDATLARRVTAVEVPEDETNLRGPSAWPMPKHACETRQLPLGPHWIMTTPLVVRLEHGVVKCVQEGDHKRCMDL